MFYIITDTLLKGALNTNKTGHHIRYNWHAIESVLQHQKNVHHAMHVRYS
jgi:hypothetical protein